MKKLYSILCLLLVASMLFSCRRARIIPDRQLGQIFHDAMLVNAYLQHKRNSVELDSMNIYEPILAKYGYTKEDMHYTLNNFARRKSASLNSVADVMINSLDNESDALNERVAVIDTIDNVARRRYIQTLLQDTAIVAEVEADSSLLQIVIPHAQKGNYRIEATYTLDKEDKGIGRRYAVSWMHDDSLIRDISNQPIARGRKGRVAFDAWLAEGDSAANCMKIDFTRFNLRKNRQKLTKLTIHDIKVTYTPPLDECIERLFAEQSQLRIFADTMLNLKIE